MKILSIVGARPEFIQSMPISRALRTKHQEVLVHTGQHYDYKMSKSFFDELMIPTPEYNLEVGSGSHARQTADMLVRLEEVFLSEKPDLVMVRGDTNSTISGALTASKLNIPFAHIEAGERSFVRSMPEEINRVVTDCLADIHFCVSDQAVSNLSSEGITKSIYKVGDVMLDAMMQILPIAREKSNILTTLNIKKNSYSLVTIHRAANTDDPVRLHQISNALNRTQDTIIFPVHPRTQLAISENNIHFSENVRLIEPMGYFDMVILEENARLIATDLGGVQREAYFLGIPCLTLRDETEWIATVESGWNILVGADIEQIIGKWWNFIPPSERPLIFGDGSAGQKIADILGSSMVRSSLHF